MILTWLLIAVSAVALLLHCAAMRHHLAANRASGAGYAGRGFAQSAALRAVFACVYLAAGSLQAAGVRIPHMGALSTGSLIIFTAGQLAGVAGLVFDLRTRHQTIPAARNPNGIRPALRRVRRGCRVRPAMAARPAGSLADGPPRASRAAHLARTGVETVRRRLGDGRARVLGEAVRADRNGARPGHGRARRPGRAERRRPDGAARADDVTPSARLPWLESDAPGICGGELP